MNSLLYLVCIFFFQFDVCLILIFINRHIKAEGIYLYSLSKCNLKTMADYK